MDSLALEKIENDLLDTIKSFDGIENQIDYNDKTHWFGKEQWIDVDKLIIDDEVQRTLMETHVRKIMKGFRPSAFGRLTVSSRGGDFYYVGDGMHRMEAAKRLGLKSLPCIIVEADSLKEEAMNFLKINENSSAVSAIDRFKIGVKGEDESWLRVKSILDDCGLAVGTNDKSFSAVSTLHKFINSPTLLSSIHAKMNTARVSLRILKESADISDIMQTSFLAMTIFVREYIETGIVTTDQSIQIFKKMDIKGRVRLAQTLKNNHSRGKIISYLAYLYVCEYNKHVKSRDEIPLRIQI